MKQASIYPDQKMRCDWANPKNQIYIDYHDNQWGVPLHDDNMWFEMLTLEGAQAGLSWETILKKRQEYKKAFKNFDPNKVAVMTEKDFNSLMQNPGIIRNRLKISSTINNAKAFIKIQKEFGSFDNYIWRFVDGKTIKNNWRSMPEVPTKTKESDAMSKDLKKRGFKFVGTTICYALMQATGLVDDHLVTCFKHKKQI